MVERTRSGDGDSPAKAGPDGADQSGDDTVTPEQDDRVRLAVSDLDRVLTRITGRVGQAATGPDEARDADSDGASTEHSQGGYIDWPGAGQVSEAEPSADAVPDSEAQPEPSTDTEADTPTQMANIPAGPEALAAAVPTPEDAAPAQEADSAGEPDTDQKPDGGLPDDADVSPAAPGGGDLAPAESPTATENAPVAGADIQSPAAEAIIKDDVKDDTPAATPSEPWPEQWGAPSQSNVLKVLGDLLAQIKGSEEKVSSPGSVVARRELVKPAAGSRGNPDPRVSLRPAKMSTETRPDAVPVKRRSKGGPKPLRRRRRSLLSRLLEQFSRSGPAEGRARAGRARGRAGGPDRALRDPAKNPTDTSRRKPAFPNTKHGRGFAPVTRHNRPKEPLPETPLRPVLEPDASMAEPPAQTHEFSPWIIDQPEFQRAFGYKNVEKEVPTTSATVSAGSAFRRLPSLPVIAALLGLVAVFAGGYAIYRTQFNELPATVEVDLIPAAPFEPPPPPVPGNRQVKLPTDASGWTIAPEVAVDEPSIRSVESFQESVETGGASPTIQVHPTIANSPTTVLVSDASDAVLDVDARNALKLLLDFNVGEAELLVAGVLARNPRHLGGLISRGRVDLLRNDFVGAESAFRQALRGSPLSGVARLGLAEAFLGQRRSAEALSILNGIVASAPDVSSAYDLRARAFAQSGDLKSMQADCQTLADQASAEFVGRWCAGLGFKDAGAKAAAVTELNAAVAGGSAAFLRHRQSYLKFRGHYSGEVDGEFGPATRQAIAACVEDPKC